MGELFVLDRNTLYPKTVGKLFVLDRNTLYHKVSNVGDRSRGRPEGYLLNSYYTKV